MHDRRLCVDLNLQDLIDIQVPVRCGDCALCVRAFNVMGFEEEWIKGKYMCNHPDVQSAFPTPELLFDIEQRMSHPPKECPLRKRPLVLGRFKLKWQGCRCCGEDDEEYEY